MAKKKEEITIRSSTAEYLTYIASVGDVETSFEMRYEDENIWLTQKLMAALYDVDVRTVNYHIKKIFADSELQEDSVIRKFRITADDGKTYNTNHYSLEMIIAVGFKVNSERAVQFRKWVNQIARDYTIKGWVMDVEHIKRGTYLTEKYFDEQLERIREIRASERKFYQKVTDLYATAIDYDRTAAATKRFYATVQNKMHFAIHGHTAAELIVERADHRKESGETDGGDGRCGCRVRKPSKPCAGLIPSDAPWSWSRWTIRRRRPSERTGKWCMWMISLPSMWRGARAAAWASPTGRTAAGGLIMTEKVRDQMPKPAGKK
jgi:hypothetical protein